MFALHGIVRPVFSAVGSSAASHRICKCILTNINISRTEKIGNFFGADFGFFCQIFSKIGCRHAPKRANNRVRQAKLHGTQH